MELLRTPLDRFSDVPDFDWPAHAIEVDAGDGSGPVRMSYLDEGPRDATPVLCLHGEPSWSFLYRKMVPPLLAAGHRVIAPDLIGFGRSDKPVDQADHTYARHVGWMASFLDRLDDGAGLRGIWLVCQDWGGLIGLHLVGTQPDRFAGVVAANTFLPTGHGTPSEAFLRWQQFSQDVAEFPTGMILQGASVLELDAAEVAAYEAPFPDETYKAGARRFPMLVPTSSDDPGGLANVEAWKGLATFDRPFITAFSDSDPVTGGQDVPLRERIAGAAGQPHVTLEGGGHFLQEDVGPELAQVVIDAIAKD